MTSKENQKYTNRIQELLDRTSKIFNIDTKEAGELFGPRKTTLVVVNHLADNLVTEGVKTGELSPIPWSQDAYIIDTERPKYTHSREAELGYIYFQNASSLLPALVLDPQSNETILDMCAAPGGKTIQLAKLSNNQANITVNDSDRTRVTIMRRLLARYKVNVVACYTQPAQYLSKHLGPELFDKILIDAPCSGEGLIDLSRPATLRYWSTKKIKRLNKLQKMIVAQAHNLLKPGGTVVYSTCTLAPEENEEVVDWAVSKLGLTTHKLEMTDKITNAHKGLLSWQTKNFSSDCTNCVRTKPNDYMEPFFVCRLVKEK